MTLDKLMKSLKLFESKLNKRKSNDSNQRSVALKFGVAAQSLEEEEMSEQHMTLLPKQICEEAREKER